MTGGGKVMINGILPTLVDAKGQSYQLVNIPPARLADQRKPPCESIKSSPTF